MDDSPLETLANSPDVLTRLAAEYGPNLLSATLVLVVGFFCDTPTSRSS